MKIAILSDIQGNASALSAVVSSARACGATHFWCLGSLLGMVPFPHETLEQLRALDGVSLLSESDRETLRLRESSPFRFWYGDENVGRGHGGQWSVLNDRGLLNGRDVSNSKKCRRSRGGGGKSVAGKSSKGDRNGSDKSGGKKGRLLWDRKQLSHQLQHDAMLRWNASQLSSGDWLFLDTLESSCRCALDGVPFFLSGGVPFGMRPGRTRRREALRLSMLRQLTSSHVLVMGGSHSRCTLVNGTWLVQVGSVGIPDRAWRERSRLATAPIAYEAHWILLHWTLDGPIWELRQEPYTLAPLPSALPVAAFPSDSMMIPIPNAWWERVFRIRMSDDTTRDHATSDHATSTETSDSANAKDPIGWKNRSHWEGLPAVTVSRWERGVYHLLHRFHGNTRHSRQVCWIALRLYDSLKPILGLERGSRLELACGALLHDVGSQAGRNHHKIGQRLVETSEDLPGGDEPLDHVDSGESSADVKSEQNVERERRARISLLVRYHRKGLPASHHRVWRDLSADSQRQVRVLAGLVRLADALDRTHCSLLRDIRCELDRPNRLILRPDFVSGGDQERMAIYFKLDLLQEALQRKISLE